MAKLPAFTALQLSFVKQAHPMPFLPTGRTDQIPAVHPMMSPHTVPALDPLLGLLPPQFPSPEALRSLLNKPRNTEEQIRIILAIESPQSAPHGSFNYSAIDIDIEYIK